MHSMLRISLTKTIPHPLTSSLLPHFSWLLHQLIGYKMPNQTIQAVLSYWLRVPSVENQTRQAALPYW